MEFWISFLNLFSGDAAGELRHYPCTTETFIGLFTTMLPTWESLRPKWEEIIQKLPIQKYRHSQFSEHHGLKVMSLLENQKMSQWYGLKKDWMPLPNCSMLFPLFRYLPFWFYFHFWIVWFEFNFWFCRFQSIRPYFDEIYSRWQAMTHFIFRELPLVWAIHNNVLMVVPDPTSPEMEKLLFPEEWFWIFFIEPNSGCVYEFESIIFNILNSQNLFKYLPQFRPYQLTAKALQATNVLYGK